MATSDHPVPQNDMTHGLAARLREAANEVTTERPKRRPRTIDPHTVPGVVTPGDKLGHAVAGQLASDE